MFGRSQRASNIDEQDERGLQELGEIELRTTKLFLCGSTRIENILRQSEFPSTQRITRRERESRNFGL